MDEGGTIGKDNRLPWRQSADLQYVKATTMGKPIIMGRRTYESIGKPLPGRDNIIITRNPDYLAEGCRVFNSIDDAIACCSDQAEAIVMGGEEVFRQTLDRVSRIYLTEIHARVDGDTYFPELEPAQWQETSRTGHTADDRNEHDYSFVVLERKS